MDGFLPLIEGFLAFALTMLALTTGVSAIVGVVHRVRRRRARGLRDMIRMFYLHEVKPLLPEDSPPSAEASTDRRADFIADMTLMPMPIVVEKMEVDEGHWHKKFESAERLSGLPWYQVLFHPRRLGRRWQTLRYSLEALTDAEFSHRLAESDVGKALKESAAWERKGLSSWEELDAWFLQMFQTVGAAASETFERYSRGWSVAIAFCLAFSVNVDSIDLLNSYLTDPELRASVIAQSDAILMQRPAEPEEPDETALAPLRERLDSGRQQLIETAGGLKAAVETRLTSALGEAEGKHAAQAVSAELDDLLQQVDGVRSNFDQLDEDLTEAEGQILGVARSLTASFPIGWSRFPNCSADASPDLRCAGQDYWSGDQGDQDRGDPGWLAILSAAHAAAPAEFSQWLTGVVLTSILLGLGTPFWVQIVTTGFSLRRWVTGEEQGQGGAGAGQAPPAAASPP